MPRHQPADDDEFVMQSGLTLTELKPVRSSSEAIAIKGVTPTGPRPVGVLPQPRPDHWREVARSAAAAQLKGCHNDERDDAAPADWQQRVDAGRAFHRLLEDMPAGTLIDAHQLAAIIWPMLPPEA